MSLRAAKGLHLALILVGVLLYLVFVLPRWWVLTGEIPSSLAIAGRLVAGIPIGLAALPVLTMLRQALGRKVKSPEVALRLRAWSAMLYVIAGALILLTAIAEIWLRLGAAGPYLFAVYGAAASIAVLGALALYLSFVAEKPPAEPKPAKPAKEKKSKDKKARADKKPRGKKKRDAVAADEVPVTTDAEAVAEEAVESDDETAETVDVVVVESVSESESEIDSESETESETENLETENLETENLETEAVVTEDETASTGLRNKRPAGKKRRLLGR